MGGKSLEQGDETVVFLEKGRPGKKPQQDRNFHAKSKISTLLAGRFGSKEGRDEKKGSDVGQKRLGIWRGWSVMKGGVVRGCAMPDEGILAFCGAKGKHSRKAEKKRWSEEKK